MKQFIFSVFISAIFLNSAFAQEDDSDLLLSVVPVIAGTLKSEEPEAPTPLKQIQKLGGRWLFSTPSDDSFTFETYFRFDPSTARQSTDPNLFIIDGTSALFEDFFLEWCDGGLASGYFADDNEYLILCDWGFPDTDLGSLYSFNRVENRFNYLDFFYIPSTNELSTGISSPGTATKLSANFKSQGSDRSINAIAEQQKRLIQAHQKSLESNRKLSPSEADSRAKISKQLKLIAKRIR